MVKDYHDYVIKDGKFVGEFEQMYQEVDDPWLHGDALDLQYEKILGLIDKYEICIRGGNVLDIGCGKGAFTARLKNKLPKARITGLDIAPTAIKKAIERHGKLGINFKVSDIIKDYKSIPGSFDLILMSQVMWYMLKDFEKIVSYLSKKSLAKMGYILINQSFYGAGAQKYGNEIIETPEEMINLVKMKLAARADTHKGKGINVLALFQKNE